MSTTDVVARRSSLRDLIRAWGALFLACGLTVVIGVRRAFSGVPLWSDEASSAMLTRHTFPGLIAVVTDSAANMGPYYLALKVWSMFGHSDGWLRMFSVVGGVVAVILVHQTLRRWAGLAAANTAVIVLAANPFFVQHLASARGYSWSMALAVATAISMEAALRERSSRLAVLAGICLGFGAALNLVSAGLVVLFSIALAISYRPWRDQLRFAAWCGLAACVSFAPFAYPYLRPGAGLTWIKAPTLLSVPRSLTEMIGGRAWAAVLAVGILLVLIGFVTAGPWAVPRSPVLIMALAGGLGLPVLLLVVSEISPMWVTRYLAPAVPLVVMVASVGLVGQRARSSVLRGGAVVAVAILLLATVSVQSDVRHEDLRAAATYVESNLQPGDVIVYYPSWARMGYEWYATSASTAPEVDVALDSRPDDEANAREVPTEELSARLAAAPRVWLVGYPNENWHPLPEPLEPLLGTLGERGVLESDQFGIEVTLLGPAP